MEIPEIDALAEYESTLHDAGTIYNYRLILLDFYEDFGVSKDSVQPLKDEITTLENKRGLKRKDGSFQKNQANIQKVKEKILRIQANTFVSGAKKEPQWAYDIIKNWFVKQQAIADSGKKACRTVRGYIRPIKGILEMNSTGVNFVSLPGVRSP